MRILLLFLVITTIYAKPEVNICTWSNYIPREVIQAFTKETGIKVNLSEFDNNETLLAKLKTSKHSGYDIITPSSYFVSRMIKQNLLQPIAKNKLPNIKNLQPLFLNRTFDPHNKYSIPYAWGTTGIVINQNHFSKKKFTWAELWQPCYKKQLMLLDDIREIFALAFLTLGYSVNETNPQHIQEAYNLLRKLLPNVKLFTADGEQTIYIDEDAIIGMIWSGDFVLSSRENKYLAYIYPTNGFLVNIDSLAIPNHAPNVKHAYQFINFIMRPDIALKIMLTTGYAVPNTAALRIAPPHIQNSAIINPHPKILQQAHMLHDIGAALRYYEKYWELLKIGA